MINEGGEGRGREIVKGLLLSIPQAGWIREASLCRLLLRSSHHKTAILPSQEPTESLNLGNVWQLTHQNILVKNQQLKNPVKYPL